MKNRNIYLSLLVGWLLLCTACSPRKVYLSTSFHEPATDGLRFIYSYDGYHWDSIPGIWLEPAVGTQRVLRDPSLVQATDGVFHLVWTSSWRNDYGIGVCIFPGFGALVGAAAYRPYARLRYPYTQCVGSRTFL